MRSIRNTFLAFFALTGLWLGLTLSTGVTPAFAQTQICGNSGTGYCLNDWNNGGYGNPVKMYYGNSSNENFWIQPINRCGNNLTTCPFIDLNLDGVIGGSAVQIRYGSTDLCVAANTANGQAVLGACNDPNTGVGGDTGTAFVDDGATLYSVYYTNLHNPNPTGDSDQPYCARSGGNPGQPLYLNYNYITNPGCTFWGGV